MTKIYEALDNAGKERIPVAPRHGSLNLSAAVPKPLEDKLLSLYQRIEALLNNRTGVLVEVVGAQPGDDAGRIARQLARLSSVRMGQRILLLSAVGQIDVTGPVTDWQEMVESGTFSDDVLRAVGDSTLYISQLATTTSGLAAILDAPGLPAVLDEVRQRFDMTIIVAQALGASPESYQLASIVDGVVVVLEAGKTRWQAAKREIGRMQAQGAKVLGTILNKRRYYIPNFVYRRV